MANDQNVGITLTANSTAVEKALEKLSAGLDKTVDKLNRVEQASAKSAKATADGMEKASNAVGSFVGALVGAESASSLVMRAATAIKAEWEHIARLQKEAAAASTTAAGAIAKARLNFSADATVGDKDLEGKLQDIARRTGVSLKDVAGSASGAFSAGAKTNAQALAAVEAGFQLAPFDSAQASELSGRAIDLSKTTGADPRAAIGFLLNTGKAARTTDLGKLGAQGLPAITGIMAQGDSAEQAAELFALTSQALADTEGSVSKTASIALSERLGSFVAKRSGKDDRGSFAVPKDQIAAFEAAKSTEARIDVMQQNPELRRAFLGANAFGTESSAFVGKLLSGDAGVNALRQQTRDTINPLDDRQIAAFDAKRASIAAGRFEGVAAAGRESASSAEGLNLADSPGARTAVARDIVEKIADRSGMNFVGRKAAQAEFEARTAVGQSPEKAAIGVAEGVRAKSFQSVMGGGAYAAGNVDEKLDRYMSEQIEILKRMEKAMADKSPQRVEVVNQNRPPTPTRRAASALQSSGR